MAHKPNPADARTALEALASVATDTTAVCDRGDSFADVVAYSDDFLLLKKVISDSDSFVVSDTNLLTDTVSITVDLA